MFWGIVFIIIGGLFFLENAGVIPNANFNLIWPLLLVALGVHILFKKGECWCGLGWRSDIRKKFSKE